MSCITYKRFANPAVEKNRYKNLSERLFRSKQRWRQKTYFMYVLVCIILLIVSVRKLSAFYRFLISKQLFDSMLQGGVELVLIFVLIIGGKLDLDLSENFLADNSFSHNGETMEDLKKDFDRAIIALNRAKLIYNEFCILFDSDENLDLFRNGAEKFFGLVFQEFQESILIKICKLTDPAVQHKNKNLTAEYFLSLEEVKNNSRYNDIKKIYDTKVVPARTKVDRYRNKYMVHSDYDTLIELSVKKPSFSEIRDLLEALEEYFSKLSNYCFGETHNFGGIVPLRCGAGYLVRLLKRVPSG